MGLEIEINSMEEMCDLMCNNQLPQNKEYKSFLNPFRVMKAKNVAIHTDLILMVVVVNMIVLIVMLKVCWIFVIYGTPTVRQ